MRMTVVYVRVMRVRMDQRRMLVFMGVWFTSVPLEIMMVPVVFIVAMAMSVPHVPMLMHVGVLLGQMQPYADPHQDCRRPEHGIRELFEQRE